jgi:alkyl hydroperoxide reductase subunit AhpF
VDRIPAIVFRGKNKGTVRYFGVPAGYEFSVLVADLLEAASGTTQLAQATREQAAALSSPVHIKVLVTPT